jgi:protein-tyrosine-phosphatase
MTSEHQPRSRVVLFLCTGNTCRSPLAEGLARRSFDAAGLEFRSAGRGAVVGQPPSEGLRQLAGQLALDLGGHRSRPVDRTLVEDVEWVIAMTRRQVAIFRKRFPTYLGKIGLLGLPGVDLARGPLPETVEEVADPFGGGAAAYQRMASQMGRLLSGWAEVLAQSPPDTQE